MRARKHFQGVVGASAIVLGAIVGCEPDRPAFHAPTNADLASWTGAQQIDLEKHAYFSTLQRELRPLSDGSEMWVYPVCSTKRDAKCSQSAWSWNTECTAHDVKKCCNHQFVLRNGSVESYRMLGTCRVGCGIRPDSKVAACQTEAAAN
jgi:hypothetical protein